MNASPEKFYVLDFIFELKAPLAGMRGMAMIVLEENNVRNSMPTEIIDWLEKCSPTFDDWAEKLDKISTFDRKDFTAAQLCQRLIDALEGLEAVIYEGNNLSKNTVLVDEEEFYFDGIISALSHIFEHYKRLHDFLP